jgi:hypothetical protein
MKFVRIVDSHVSTVDPNTLNAATSGYVRGKFAILRYATFRAISVILRLENVHIVMQLYAQTPCVIYMLLTVCVAYDLIV